MAKFDSDHIILLFCFIFLIFITLYLNKIYSYHDPLIDKIKQDLLKVDPRVEELSFHASNESFTEDKRFVYLCLKDKDDKYYDYNMIMYVSLHELAHAFSDSVDTDHTGKEFKDNFRNLLNKAQTLGLYDPKIPLVYDYCPRS
jgi:hypothetical protein